MELTVSPDDLHAAAASVSSCAHRLASARAAFVLASAGAVPVLGPHASGTAGDASDAAEAATEVVVEDIRHLAQALRVLARVYDHVDRVAGVAGATDPTGVRR
jgi:hypothetical protein